MSVRVIVIEDQPETRRSLKAALEAGGLQVVGDFEDGRSALAAVRGLEVEVALVDLGLPGISGHDTIRGLRQRAPQLKVLVLTVLESADAILDAVAAGASGYLLKSAPLAELCAAVHQVRDGLTPISPWVAHHLLTTLRAPATKEGERDFGLSPRETEVLGLLVRGHTYGSIAISLGVGLGTVQGYVKNVYRKLEVASKAEATWLAVSRGLVPADEP